MKNWFSFLSNFIWRSESLKPYSFVNLCPLLNLEILVRYHVIWKVQKYFWKFQSSACKIKSKFVLVQLLFPWFQNNIFETLELYFQKHWLSIFNKLRLLSSYSEMIIDRYPEIMESEHFKYADLCRNEDEDS
jgi:hypothetical protein